MDEGFERICANSCMMPSDLVIAFFRSGLFSETHAFEQGILSKLFFYSNSGFLEASFLSTAFGLAEKGCLAAF